MTEQCAPEVVLDRAARPDGAGLSDEDRARLRDVLQRKGFVLLPSDTAFSVAALLLDAGTRSRINLLLDRGDEPISLAFGSVAATRRWIAPNDVVERLLGALSPGPITVVCSARPRGIPRHLLNQAVASENRTIGVRIPDSAVEREVATLTPYPITTVAVREGGDVVTSAADARRVVRRGLARAGFPCWAAVDGSPTYGAHSTVVEVTADGHLRMIRQGDLPEADVRRVARAAGNPHEHEGEEGT